MIFVHIFSAECCQQRTPLTKNNTIKTSCQDLYLRLHQFETPDVRHLMTNIYNLYSYLVLFTQSQKDFAEFVHVPHKD